ncbi:hypothetical protein [Plantactinospora sp. GCM10030261]|uniref:hypothetical protein n=1 Tax=Plantactinospora sp. GCM10030261 TaxID=3273420 RepID=UPI00361144C9
MLSETSMAYDLYAPLWALVEVGAIAANGCAAPPSGAVVDHVRSRAEQIETLLDNVRSLGSFAPETIAIFNGQGGWDNDAEFEPEAMAAKLLLYSGYLAEHPLDWRDTESIRQLVAATTDRQLVSVLDALVGIAISGGMDADTAAGRVAEAFRAACVLVRREPSTELARAVRHWRAHHLPPVLRPDSPTQDETKAKLRHVLRRLEDIALPDSAPADPPGRGSGRVRPQGPRHRPQRPAQRRRG